MRMLLLGPPKAKAKAKAKAGLRLCLLHPPSSPSAKQVRAAAAMSSSSSALAKGKSATSKFEPKGGRSLATSSKAKRGKAEKKVYSLPGQKFDPPEEREPLRIFYESLSKQIPSSEMAEFWLMEHGLLSPERAKKAYDRKQKRQQQIRLGTPVKSSVKKVKPESWKKPITSHGVGSIAKAKKRVDYSDDDDDDFIVKMKRFRG